MSSDKDTDKDDDLIMVGPGAEEEGDADTDKDSKETVDSDSDEDFETDGEEGDDDERVGHSEHDYERPDKPYSQMSVEEKKKFKADRKKHRRETADRNRREMTFLRKRNEDLERKFSTLETRTAGTEVATIDGRISQIQAQIKIADEVISGAVEKQNGKAMVEAQEIKARLIANLGKLTDAKEQIQGQMEESSKSTSSKAANEAPTVSQVVIKLGRAWHSKHKWYDASLRDPDSQIVKTIDDQVGADGYDPETREYWEELSKRMQKYLPHRFKAAAKDDDETEEDTKKDPTPGKKKGGGPKFSTGGREHRLRKNEVYVSPERREALVELGVWEDKKLRDRYLKSYAKYDKDAQGSRS